MPTTTLPPRKPASRRLCGLPATLAVSLALGACVAHPPREAAAPRARPAPPSTQVYFYPTRGQGEERQDRDRYECYLWAVRQTGFDPSQPNLAPHQRFEAVTRVPPGHDTAVGTVGGAVLGAVVAPPGRKAEGAAIGAVAGAVAGAASDAAREQAVEQVQRKADKREVQRIAALEQKAANYRRAMTACLEGRGYSVR